MAVVIDSNILIDFERGSFDLDKHITDRQEEFYLSAITASELLHGLFRSTNTSVTARRREFVEGILRRFKTLPIDLSVARVHAEIYATLLHSGQTIGIHDCWIGATCISNGFSLATRNIREFNRIPNLKIELWD